MTHPTTSGLRPRPSPEAISARGGLGACIAGALLLAIGGGIDKAEAETRYHDRGRSQGIVAPPPPPRTGPVTAPAPRPRTGGFIPFRHRPVVMRKREQRPPRRAVCTVRPCFGG
jgi:hypothetical protein